MKRPDELQTVPHDLLGCIFNGDMFEHQILPAILLFEPAFAVTISLVCKSWQWTIVNLSTLSAIFDTRQLELPSEISDYPLYYRRLPETSLNLYPKWLNIFSRLQTLDLTIKVPKSDLLCFKSYNKVFDTVQKFRLNLRILQHTWIDSAPFHAMFPNIKGLEIKHKKTKKHKLDMTQHFIYLFNIREYPTLQICHFTNTLLESDGIPFPEVTELYLDGVDIGMSSSYFPKLKLLAIFGTVNFLIRPFFLAYIKATISNDELKDKEGVVSNYFQDRELFGFTTGQFAEVTQLQFSVLTLFGRKTMERMNDGTVITQDLIYKVLLGFLYFTDICPQKIKEIQFYCPRSFCPRINEEDVYKIAVTLFGYDVNCGWSVYDDDNTTSSHNDDWHTARLMKYWGRKKKISELDDEDEINTTHDLTLEGRDGEEHGQYSSDDESFDILGHEFTESESSTLED
jgi:hypothetical protein